jgi:hypothetical protein
MYPKKSLESIINTECKRNLFVKLNAKTVKIHPRLAPKKALYIVLNFGHGKGGIRLTSENFVKSERSKVCLSHSPLIIFGKNVDVIATRRRTVENSKFFHAKRTKIGLKRKLNEKSFTS